MKTDERAIILTNKDIYRVDAKKGFHSKKPGLPMADIIGVSVTPGKEQLVVVHTASNNDLIFYMNTKTERVGEFIGRLAKLKQKS